MTILTFDVGRTGCRAALWSDGTRVRECAGPGTGVVTGVGGADATLRCITEVAARLGETPEPETVVAGIAGLLSAPEHVDAVVAGLGEAFGDARVIVTSDAVTSHAGALSGRSGVVLAAGTGTSVVGLGEDGALHLVDGWGHLLGDAGSGSAIGRAGIESALRAHDGRGGSTVLLDRLGERLGAPRDVPRLVQRADNPARVLAGFAREVFDAARAGDPEARGICTRAATELADSAVAAVHRAALGDAPLVTTVGGLWQAGPVLCAPFDRALAELLPGTARRAADADALTGAHLLATRPDLPHLRSPATWVGEPVAAPAVTPSAASRPTSIAHELAALDTERSRPGVRLETMGVAELVESQLVHDRAVQPAVEAAGPQITAALEATVDRLEKGGRLVYVGAGTPGRLARLDAAECLPTFGVGPEMVTALMAGGEEAMLRAVEGAEDDVAAGAADIRAEDIGPQDVVVGITASGRTPYVVAAVETARAAGAVTIGITNNPRTALAAAVNHPIETLTGPEFITGSTRLKAGAAQKQVLNLLSTLAMVRLGKVHGTLMVDVHVTNAKLRHRGQRIVMEATGTGPEAAEHALAAADGHAKTAIAMLLLGLPVESARERLAAAHGRLGAVVGGGT